MSNMKRILITGANSYIGCSFEKYLSKFNDEYYIETVDMLDGTWRDKSFSGYDVVFHVAGIAHSDGGKISLEKEKLYYSVNTDLTIQVAKKAKLEGVKQIVFMSSIIVYENSVKIGKQSVITKETLPKPNNCYGNSKLMAEKALLEIEDENFKVVILRPPMIYGKGCKGNYIMLSKFAKKLPFFPYVKNQRSMLYIENLNEFIRLIIKNEDRGVFYPQNAEYVNTSEMVKQIALVNGRKIKTPKGFTWILKILSLFTNKVNKAFGSLVYDKDISVYKENYNVKNFVQSIEETES